MVIEKCFNELITIESELLWKLLFIEFGQEHKGEYIYDIIWQMHHIIGDGQSANSNLVFLIELIQKAINEETIEINEFRVFEGCQFLFAREIESITKRTQFPKITRPYFINVNNAQKNIFCQIKDDDEIRNELELIDLQTNAVFTNLTDLVRISRNLNSTKFVRFCLRQKLETIHKRF